MSTGEDTGRIDEMLLSAAGQYEFKVSEAVDGLSAAIEPILLVLAIYLPMWDMMGVVQ